MIEIKGGRMSGKSYLDEEDHIESPLEALQDLSKLIFIHGGVEQYKIIETALKHLEVLEQELCVVKTMEDLTIEAIKDKKLKAFDIIKEKGVNVGVFLNRIKRDTDYKEYKRLCCLYKIMAFSEKDLTQKEYNLLKEVLKND